MPFPHIADCPSTPKVENCQTYAVCPSDNDSPVQDHTASTPEPEPAPQTSLFRRLLARKTTRRLMLASLFIFFLKTFVGEASVVPTASMEGTIHVGDHLIMSKLLYGPEIPLLH